MVMLNQNRAQATVSCHVINSVMAGLAGELDEGTDGSPRLTASCLKLIFRE